MVKSSAIEGYSSQILFVRVLFIFDRDNTKYIHTYIYVVIYDYMDE